MVVLSEIGNMFWGVTLDVGKRYTQTVERGFHISMAALEPGLNKDDTSAVSVMIEHNKNNFMLCTLQHNRIFQQPLDLNFNEGEELTLYLKGKGNVHLTGYLHIDDEDDMDMTLGTEDMGSEDDDVSSSDQDSSLDEDDDLLADSKKRKKQLKGPDSKKQKVEIVDKNDDDFDSSDDDEDDEEKSEDSEDDDNKDDSFLEKKKKKSKDEKVKKAVEDNSKPKTSKDSPVKQNSALPQTPATPQTDASSGGEESSKKKKKKNKKKKKQQEAATPTDSNKDSTNKDAANKDSTNKDAANKDAANKSQTPKQSKAKRVAEGGVTIEDLKEGHGPEAKIGKKVQVYYTGRLQNGKIFDTKTTGTPFKFKVGKKDVISGWDVGLAGMKVGGKRKLIIPPKMGYGSQSVGGIPPNSTLYFEVELKAVN